MLCRGPAPRRDDVFEHLRAEDFHVPAHRMIFGATRRLYDDNQPIDTVTMVDKLHRGGEPDQAGGASFSWSGSGMRHPAPPTSATTPMSWRNTPPVGEC